MRGEESCCQYPSYSLGLADLEVVILVLSTRKILSTAVDIIYGRIYYLRSYLLSTTRHIVDIVVSSYMVMSWSWSWSLTRFMYFDSERVSVCVPVVHTGSEKDTSSYVIYVRWERKWIGKESCHPRYMHSMAIDLLPAAPECWCQERGLETTVRFIILLRIHVITQSYYLQLDITFALSTKI